jgi:hypothetical protein
MKSTTTNHNNTTSSNATHEPPTQHETNHCLRSSALLSQVILGIASHPQSFSHPLLVRTVAKTMETLAGWIDVVAENNNGNNNGNNGNNGGSIIQAVVTYLVACLNVHGAKQAVSVALQRIMNKCGRWMFPLLSQLVHQINNAMAALTPESRICLVDGLATIAVQMNNHDEARAGLEALCNPILDRLEQGLSACSNNNAELREKACSVVCNELKTFAAAMNHVDHLKSHSRIAKLNTLALQKVAGNLMQRAWPIVTSTLAVQHSGITTEVFSLFHVLIRSITPLMGSYVGSIVDAAVSTYQQTLSHAALICLTGVVESYGATQVEQLRQMLFLLYEPTANVLSGDASVLAAHAETIREFFLLVHRVGLFCPEAFQLETLRRIIPLATKCCVLKEFKPCKQVLLVLVLLLKISPKINSDPIKHTLHVNVNQIMNTNDNGSRLALTLLTSISTTAPSRLVGQHAEVLYLLASRYMNECQQWIFQYLSTISVNEVAGLTPESKQHILTLLFDTQGNNAQRHKKRFKGVLVDFSKICRGESTADVLTGWMLADTHTSAVGGVIDLS